MVRKIISCFVVCMLLVGAFCTQAHADTHTIYDEGSLSTTYVTYFKDIVSGIGFNENYVAFRSGQYSYTLVVGELEYINGVISLIGESAKEYEFRSITSSGYNQQYKYYVYDITEFSVTTDDNIIYSDVGEYPQLVERGAKYEMLSAVLLCIMCLSVVISRIFNFRKR